MKKVYASQDRLMIGHLKNLLINEGLECVLKNDFLASAMGEVPLNECWLEIWIEKDSDFDKAKGLIESTFSVEPSAGPKWTCSGCGEEHGPQYTGCWNCGKDCP